MRVECYECGTLCEVDETTNTITDSWTCPACVHFYDDDGYDEDEAVESACCMANPAYASTKYTT